MNKILAFTLIGITLIVIVIIAFFAFVLPKQKNDIKSKVLNIETQFSAKKYQETISLSEAFIKNHPRSKKVPDIYYYLAIAKQKIGNDAIDLWEKIIKDYPKSAKISEAYYYFGNSMENSQKYDQAIENYTAVINKFPDSLIVAGALLGMGRLHEMKGQLSDAISNYQSIINKYLDSEFVIEAEQRLDNIALAKFIEENTKFYEIGSGESLVSIANKFHTTSNLIIKLNNLANARINKGQKIKVIDGSSFNITIDLSECKLYLKSNENIIKRYYVCPGKNETPTPKGSYNVTEKMVDPTWFSGAETGGKGIISGGDPRNELGTRWIGFKPTFRIHGTIFPQSIGKAESHGCVRMHNKDVEELYDLVTIGTPIKIIE